MVITGVSGSDVYLSSEEIDADVCFSGNVSLTNGVSSATRHFSGAITGSGNFSFTGSLTVGESYLFSGDVSGYSGSFIRETGSTDVAQNKLTFGKGDPGVTTGSVSGTGIIQWGSEGKNWNVVYNYSNDVYASNTITAGAIVKQGAGALELRGENTSMGGVTVSAGILVAANAKALGTGAVSVAAGATLKLAVGVAGVGAVSLADGAVFAIDMAGFNPVSVLGDENQVALSILSSTALAFNGVSASTLSSAEIEQYFDDTKSNLGNWSEWYREWSYDDNSGTLNLTLTIPEPSAFGLLAGVGALALVASRRRRNRR